MNIEIEKFLQNAVQTDVFPGCCCAIIRPDKTDYYCVGNKAIEPDIEENEMDTLYDLASLTKVVGMLPVILKLIQDGLLTYDTKVSSIIPTFTNSTITILDLLTHRSGLPSDLGWGNEADKKKMIDDICAYAKNVKRNNEVIYSDLGFMMLGVIAETITNTSLDELVQKYVTIPLKMERTRYCPKPSLKKQCAPTEDSLRFQCLLRGEVHDRKAHFMQGISGHAGLFSNIYDLEKYTRMLLGGGIVDGQVYLKQNFIVDMYTSQTPSLNIHRGVGFLTFDEEGIFSCLNSKKTMVHTGFTGTSLLVDIENQIAILLLSNRIHPSRNNTKILNWRKEFHHFVMETYNK